MNAMKRLVSSLAAYSDEQLKIAAWANTTPVGDGDDFRMDCDGRHICWSEYGLRSQYGWQVDHIVARALGGPDIPKNVRARHWLGNAQAGGLLGNAMLNMRR